MVPRAEKGRRQVNMALQNNIRAGRAFIEIALDQSSLQKGLKNAQRQLQAFGASLTAIGARLLTLATVAGAPFALAGKNFADFDDEMRLTLAVTGATAQDFQVLTDTAERLGRETSFMAKEVAQGMTAMGRMGFKAQEINEAIASVLNLARATGTDLGEAADIAANNLRVFGLAARDMDKVVDLLTATANGSAQTLHDLAEGFKMAGPQAAAAGDDIRNVAGALGVLANMGIKGSLAGTALRKAYSQFANLDIQKKLLDFGIETVDADGNLRAMSAIMAEIGQVMTQMPTGERLAFAEEIFNLRGSLAGLQLGGNIKELQDFIAMLDKAAGTAAATASEKVLFHKRIKDVEQRLNDPTVILNSFILSWTRYPQLQWGNTQDELEDMHVLFMTNDRDRYIDKLFSRLRGMVT
jgi:TP901 family phage tail tape measure protein